MKKELRSLIYLYLAKTAELIPQIAYALGVTLPITNMEWANLNVPQRGTTGTGLRFFKHGYGVDIKYNGGEIDIDFGANGEYDGFDAWRLFRFAEVTGTQTPYTDHREIAAELEEAEKNKEVRFSGYILYYLNEPRHVNNKMAGMKG
jgi:hypothetical protein